MTEIGDVRLVNAATCGHHPNLISLWCFERLANATHLPSEEFGKSPHDQWADSGGEINVIQGMWLSVMVLSDRDIAALSANLANLEAMRRTARIELLIRHARQHEQMSETVATSLREILG